jgi:hypothetical protein
MHAASSARSLHVLIVFFFPFTNSGFFGYRTEQEPPLMSCACFHLMFREIARTKNTSSLGDYRTRERDQLSTIGPVHLAYNPSYSACFFSRNNIFLSQKISQQCFSAGL